MYPRNAEELIQYLQNYPEMNVSLPHKQTIYTFQRRDGNKIDFATPDQRVVTLNLTRGLIDYHAEGFTRRVGKYTAHFQYTGNKPWQNICDEEKVA